MGMMRRMLVAFLGAAPAGLDAGAQNGVDIRLPCPGPARGDRARHPADLGAIQAEANAAAEFRYHLLAEAGIGAERSAGGAVVTGFDAADQGGIGISPQLRMGPDHGLDMHGWLLSRLWRKASCLVFPDAGTEPGRHRLFIWGQFRR